MRGNGTFVFIKRPKMATFQKSIPILTTCGENGTYASEFLASSTKLGQSGDEVENESK